MKKISKIVAIFLMSGFFASLTYANFNCISDTSKQEICVGDIVYPAQGKTIFASANDFRCKTSVAGVAFNIAMVASLFLGGTIIGIPVLAAVVETLLTWDGFPIAACGTALGVIAEKAITYNTCGSYATVMVVRKDGTIEIAFGIQSYFSEPHRVKINDVKIVRDAA